MFNQYFYHERIRKTVALFGSLFTRISVVRKDANGKVMSQVQVPLAYAPRSKFLARLQQVGDLNTDQSVAIKLPRMTFEMTSIAYDSTRQLAKTNNQLRNSSANDGTKRTKIRQSTPYIITFSLGIYCNNQDDALQIVEQILPYFSPTYTVTIKPYSDYPDIKEDTPITLQSVAFLNEFEGAQETRQTVQYTLDFEVKVNFTGPISDGSIITKAITEFEFNEGNKFLTVNTEADPNTILYDSDYGFTETYDYENVSDDDV